MVEITEIPRRQKQTNKKDIMYITKIDSRKGYKEGVCFWLITLHITNPNCLLSEVKVGIANIIRSTYLYPDDIVIFFIVLGGKQKYNTGVSELIDGTTFALLGADLLVAEMIREKYEGGIFECINVKKEGV